MKSNSTNMNKLIFSEGGQPLFLDDIDFLQQSALGAVRPFLRAFGGCILSEATIDIGTDKVAWRDGTLLIDGEVCEVKAGELAITADTANLFFRIHRVPTERRIFGNGAEHPTREMAQAEATLSVASDEQYLRIPLTGSKPVPYFSEVLRSHIVKELSIRPSGEGGATATFKRVRISDDITFYQGSVNFEKKTDLSEGSIMHFENLPGRAYGRGLVRATGIAEGAYVVLNGSYAELREASGALFKSVPAGTRISFSVIAD